MRRLEGYPAGLLVAFLVAILVVGAAGVLALVEFSSGAATRETEERSALEDLMLTERVRADVERTLASGRGFLLAGDPDSLERAREAEADVGRGLHDLRSRIQTAEGGRLLSRLEAAINSYDRSLNGILDAKTDGVSLDVITRRFERELLPSREDLDRAIDAFLAHRQGRLVAAFAAGRRGDRVGLGVALGFVVLSMLAAGVVSLRAAKRLATMAARQQDAVRMAELAVAARQQLLATVAHDLRGPLSTLTIKATIIRQSTEIEKAHEQAAGIENVSMRMEYLIRSLLDAASLDAGGFSVTPTNCDADEILRDAIDMFSSLAASKTVQIDSAASGKGLRVHADRERSLQVISNLLGNALKFTPQGGKITLSAEAEGDWIRFAVADNGPGIAPEHVAHLFTRFWKTETAESKGTGLGLFISKGIVEAHGGRIWVESQLGHGAVFRFTLPKSATAQGGEPRGEAVNVVLR
jgi:signal transduction histidine kinase